MDQNEEVCNWGLELPTFDFGLSRLLEVFLVSHTESQGVLTVTVFYKNVKVWERRLVLQFIIIIPYSPFSTSYNNFTSDTELTNYENQTSCIIIVNIIAKRLDP